MFCFKCGFELNDAAIFCQKCGTKQEPMVTEAPSIREDMVEKEISNQALKVYLGDLLALECIKKKYQDRIRRLDKDIIHMQETNLYMIYGIFEPYDPRKIQECLHFFYDGNKYYIAICKSSYATEVYVNWHLSENYYYWLELDKKNMKYLKKIKAWQKIKESYSNRSQRKKAIENFPGIYEEFKSNAPDWYKHNINVLKNSIEIQGALPSELIELDNMLQKMYRVNIIPGAFRNLYAIYYLHDFISTSNQSLSTALLHYDLNEIKAKLDTIIEQQQEIIIQQAVMLAQNEKMLEQNARQLKKLASIESNTSLAATYSEIAANNAEACAWIGLANYISK